MAVQNIYYIDQFNYCIMKTDSDKTLEEFIEDLQDLGGGEVFIDLQVSSNYLFLFGASGLVLRRRFEDSSWETLLNSIQQSAMLSLPGSVHVPDHIRLNGQNSKTRAPIVTCNGQIYIAYTIYLESQGLTYNTQLHHFDGNSWSLLRTFDRSRFCGWADLDYLNNLVGLKLSRVRRATAHDPDNSSWEDGKSQVYGNANFLCVCSGTDLRIVEAPYNSLSSKMEATQLGLPAPTPGYNYLGAASISTNNVVVATSEKIIRINLETLSIEASDWVSPFVSYTCGVTVAGSKLLIYDSQRPGTKNYVVYDLAQDQISYEGIWSLQHSGIAALPLSSGNFLVYGGNLNTSWIYDPETDLLVQSGFRPSNAFEFLREGSYCNLPNGDLLISPMNEPHLNIYGVADGLWSQCPLPEASVVPKLALIGIHSSDANDGRVVVLPTGGNFPSDVAYLIYNPDTNDFSKIAYRSDTNLLPFSSTGRVLEDYPYYHTFGDFGDNEIVTGRITLNIQTDTLVTAPLFSLAWASFRCLTKSGSWISEVGPQYSSEGLALQIASVHLTELEMTPRFANIQAVTSLSSNSSWGYDLYCVSVNGDSIQGYWSNNGTDPEDPTPEVSASIYKTDAEGKWILVHEIPASVFTFQAITGWGEAGDSQTMPYTPLLMAGRQVEGEGVELVMLRDALASVYRYEGGVLYTSVVTPIVGAENTYEGKRAPSIPFVYNDYLSSSVSFYADNN